MTESRQADSVQPGQPRVAKFLHLEPKRFVINTVRPDAHLDMMRRETLESLLDGRAKWPDGTPREIGIPLWERMKLKEAARSQP